MPGLADARDDHFTFALNNGVCRTNEILTQTFRQAAGLLQFQHQGLTTRV